MDDFKVRITYQDGSMDIFTKVYSISVNDDGLEMEYEGEETCDVPMSTIDEITIKPNL